MTRYLTPHAYNAMRQQGRIEMLNGEPHIRINLPEPGGAIIKEPVTIATIDAWDYDMSGWHYIKG